MLSNKDLQPILVVGLSNNRILRLVENVHELKVVRRFQTDRNMEKSAFSRIDGLTGNIKAGSKRALKKEFTSAIKVCATHKTVNYCHRATGDQYEFTYSKRGRIELLQTTGMGKLQCHLEGETVDTHSSKPRSKLQWVIVDGLYRPTRWIRREITGEGTVISERKIVVRDNTTITGDVLNNHSSRLIYGRTQSGKTRESCEAMAARMRIDGCTGVFVCRDYRTELDEQTMSIADTVNEISPHITVVQVGGSKVTGNGGDGAIWRSSDPSSPVWSELIHSMKTRDATRLYTVMGNVSTLTKIMTSFSDGDRVRFTCCVDEADIYVNDCARASVLKALLSFAICKYFISATLLDVSSLVGDNEIVEAVPAKFAFTNEVDGDDRVYRSLHGVTRYDPKNRGRSVSAAIDNGKQIITEAILLGYNTEYNQKGLPYIFCHFHTDVNEENKQIAVGISSETYSAYNVPVITFDQQGIQMYQSGEVTTKFTRLNEALQKVKDDKLEFVYLMGGKMCSRAFRVTSKDWTTYISLMIYGWGNSDAALMVQRMGRMSGLTPKNLVCAQRIYVDKKIFYKAIDCTSANSEMIRTVSTNPDDQFGVVKRRVVLSKRHTNVRLSKCGVEKEFDIDLDKENIHGELKEWEGTTTVTGGRGSSTTANRGDEIRLVREKLVTGAEMKRIYDATVNEVMNSGAGRWHTRSSIVRAIMDDSDVNGVLQSEATIQGHLRGIYQTKCQTAGVTENTRGLIMKKVDDTIYVLVN